MSISPCKISQSFPTNPQNLNCSNTSLETEGKLSSLSPWRIQSNFSTSKIQWWERHRVAIPITKGRNGGIIRDETKTKLKLSRIGQTLNPPVPCPASIAHCAKMSLRTWTGTLLLFYNCSQCVQSLGLDLHPACRHCILLAPLGFWGSPLKLQLCSALPYRQLLAGVLTFQHTIWLSRLSFEILVEATMHL